jgi:hypothetical protein
MWRLTDYPAEKIAAEIIVAGIYNKKEMDESSLHLASRMGSFALNRLRNSRLYVGESLMMTSPQKWQVPWILWLGLGDPMEFSEGTLRDVLKKCTDTLQGIGVKEPCFTLLGEGAHNQDLARLVNTLINSTPFSKGEIFHPRREMLYRLFAASPSRFYYKLLSPPRKGG